LDFVNFDPFRLFSTYFLDLFFFGKLPGLWFALFDNFHFEFTGWFLIYLNSIGMGYLCNWLVKDHTVRTLNDRG
jgi:hypothetical protein